MQKRQHIDDWRHLSDQNLEMIAEKKAPDWLLKWAKYHTSKEKQNCITCREKLEKIEPN